MIEKEHWTTVIKPKTGWFDYVGNGGFSLQRVQAFIERTTSIYPIKSFSQLKKEYLPPAKWKRRFRIFLILCKALGYKNTMRHYKYQIELNEDLFWCVYLKNTRIALSVPDVLTASRFSLEMGAELFYQHNQSLPFGCHAWQKYDYDTLWKIIFQYWIPMNKKLSIITVNYNNAKGLKQTIESILCQSFTDFEYIVIDGASTDESVEVIRQYADRISYWVSEPDSGIYQAMNKGIRIAKGKYLQFLNSGDVFYNEQVLSEVFRQSYPEDMLTGAIIRIYPDGKEVLEKGWAQVREKQGRQMTLFDFFVGYLPHQATFIRKTVFEQYGLYDETDKIVSDRLFFMKTIGLNNVSIKYLDIVMVCFDMNGISNTNPGSRNRENEAAEVRLIPASLLLDYRYFAKMDQDFHKVMKYKFTYRFCRWINRLVTLYEIVVQKNTELG